MSLSLGKQHLQLSVSFLLSYSVFNEQLPRLSPHGGDDGIRFESNSKLNQSPLPHYFHGGDDGIRTHDPLLAGQVLSQLSYTPGW